MMWYIRRMIRISTGEVSQDDTIVRSSHRSLGTWLHILLMATATLCLFVCLFLELKTGMEIGGWVALGYLTQAVGLQTSDASVCAFLCSLTVVSASA